MVSSIREENIAGFMKLHGSNTIKNALRISGWSLEDNVLSMKMEQILAEPVESVEAILAHVRFTSQRPAAEIWAAAKSADTLTKSRTYPGLEWVDEDEKVFRALGGVQANQRLGYEK